MTWFALALTAALTSASNVFASKLLLGNLKPLMVGGWVHVLGGLICLLGLPFVQPRLGLEPRALAGLLLMALIYTVGNALYFSALVATPLSEIDFFLRTSSLWTFVGGVFLLSEPFGLGALLGAILILASVFSLSPQHFPLRFSKAQWLALGAALAFGAGNLVDKALSSYFDALSYTILNQLSTGLGMLALARVRPSDLRVPQLWGWSAWAVGLTFALTQALLMLAYQAGGGAGQVILLAQARLLILLAAGIVVLGERERLGVKLLATVSMLSGIFVLYALG